MRPELDPEFEDIGPEYKIIRKIGSGAYSSVWDAIHVESGKKVAIKKETDVFDDLIDCKRLLREVKLLRSLQHPNVVRLTDLLTPPRATVANFDTIYLVLDIADASLANLIKSHLHLDAKQVRKIMYNMLLGLNYVHSAGVLHRDLKPGNVLVNKDCSVRICDFGLSRSIVGIGVYKKPPAPVVEPDSSSSSSDEDDKEDEAAEAKRPVPAKVRKSIKPRVSISAAATQDVDSILASKGMVPQTEQLADIPAVGVKKEAVRRLTSHVVTRWYRAPEVILMQENYGAPIDVWSAGCIFAELLTTIKENTPSAKDRRPLFPGTSCLLLSPYNAQGGRKSILSVASTDQLCVIIDTLGNLKEEDVAFVKDQNVLDFLKMMPESTHKINFESKYPGSGAEAIDLLQRMLAFNPNRRITVEECLSHPYFAPARNKTLEAKASVPVTMEFENEAELTEARLRQLFGEEFAYYKAGKQVHA